MVGYWGMGGGLLGVWCLINHAKMLHCSLGVEHKDQDVTMCLTLLSSDFQLQSRYNHLFSPPFSGKSSAPLSPRGHFLWLFKL